jgi:uncharacterized membrane protein
VTLIFNMKLNSRRYAWLLPTLWLAFGLRVYHLSLQSIWWDEGHSIFVASQPISHIPTLPAMDVHPPAYFALLHLWLALAGNSEFGLRYLSVLFSLLTVPLLWRLARSLARQPGIMATWIVPFLIALSPLHVAYAQEVRSYALLAFLAVASTYFLWQIVTYYPKTSLGATEERAYPRSSFGLIIPYVLLTAVGLYTHYFTIFLLLFQNLVWLVWVLFGSRGMITRKARAALWLAAQLGILLLFIPQLALALRQITGYTNPNLVPPGLAEFVSRSWQIYTVGPITAPNLSYWGAAIIALVLLVHIIRSRFFVPTLFLAGWLVIPLAAYFLLLQRQPSFEPRYLILVTPALLLLLALGPGREPGVWDYILYALPLFIFALTLYNYYTDETGFKDDSAGVAAWLAAETTADDVVYVDVPHPFHYYAERYHIPAPIRYLFVNVHTAADVLTREAAGHRRLYWITWRGSDTDPRGVIPFLAQKYGQQLGQRDFRGYHVTWFSLPDAGTLFSVPTNLPPQDATFGDVLRLDGAAYGGSPAAAGAILAGQSAWVTLHFSLLRDTDVNYRVSVRLRAEDGRIVAQVDKDLLNDRHFRTAAWPLADPALNQAINVYTLPLPADTSPGRHRLEVVIYNAEPPYPSEGVSGAATPDNTAALLGQIVVVP